MGHVYGHVVSTRGLRNPPETLDTPHGARTGQRTDLEIKLSRARPPRSAHICPLDPHHRISRPRALAPSAALIPSVRPSRRQDDNSRRCKHSSWRRAPNPTPSSHCSHASRRLAAPSNGSDTTSRRRTRWAHFEDCCAGVLRTHDDTWAPSPSTTTTITTTTTTTTPQRHDSHDNHDDNDDANDADEDHEDHDTTTTTRRPRHDDHDDHDAQRSARIRRPDQRHNAHTGARSSCRLSLPFAHSSRTIANHYGQLKMAGVQRTSGLGGRSRS